MEVLMSESKLQVFIVSFFPCLQVFLAKVLNHMLPSLSLGSIESKWVSRDKKQVGDKVLQGAYLAGRAVL